MESDGWRELDWLVQLRARGSFGVDRHVCVVRCSGSGRSRNGRGGWTRAVWLLGGAGAMGTGIWSMHYIGMLAFMLPIPVAYHWPTVLLSLLAAILAAVVALGVVSRPKMGAFPPLAGTILLGAGIASIPYIGMAAMRLPAVRQFTFFL